MHESVDKVQREMLYLQIANRLQLHREDRIAEEGYPTLKEMAEHYMAKVGNEHATMAPFSNEYTEWYYGRDDEPTAWCKDIVTPVDLFDPYGPFSTRAWIPSLPIYKGFKTE